MGKKMKIAVGGSSGFIGRPLITQLEAQGHHVIRLVREASDDPRDIFYDYEHHQISAQRLEGLDAVINLAGQSLAGGLWNSEYKKLIFDSRVKQSEFLSHILANLDEPPKVVLGTSAVGFYGDRGDEILTEHSKPGKGFLAETCRIWEDAYLPLSHAGVRVCHLRTGVVLDTSGGMLNRMMLPFQLGLGGIIGSGKQYVSWIALKDLIDAIQFLSDHNHLDGPFNLSAPNPITQTKFAMALASHLKRPCLIRYPEWMLRLPLGELGEELLFASQRMMPDRLMRHDFPFSFQEVEQIFSK